MHRYDEKWEWEASKALQGYFHVNEAQMDELLRRSQETCSCEIPKLSAALQSRNDTAVVDLRQPGDFDNGRLPGSINIPLAYPGAKSPFFDPATLSSLWTALEEEFSAAGDATRNLQNKEILLVCYDGDCARVGASVMRSKGYEANSLRAGLDGLVTMISTPQSCNRAENERRPSWIELCEAQQPSAPSAEASNPAQPRQATVSV